MSEKNQRFIVAEISKNWPPVDDEILSQKFEHVINLNHSRGYRLQEWKLNRMRIEGVMNETIIAVFELWDLNKI